MIPGTIKVQVVKQSRVTANPRGLHFAFGVCHRLRRLTFLIYFFRWILNLFSFSEFIRELMGKYWVAGESSPWVLKLLRRSHPLRSWEVSCPAPPFPGTLPRPGEDGCLRPESPLLRVPLHASGPAEGEGQRGTEESRWGRLLSSRQRAPSLLETFLTRLPMMTGPVLRAVQPSGSDRSWEHTTLPPRRYHAGSVPSAPASLDAWPGSRAKSQALRRTLPTRLCLGRQAGQEADGRPASPRPSCQAHQQRPLWAPRSHCTPTRPLVWMGRGLPTRRESGRGSHGPCPLGSSGSAAGADTLRGRLVGRQGCFLPCPTG